MFLIFLCEHFKRFLVLESVLKETLKKQTRTKKKKHINLILNLYFKKIKYWLLNNIMLTKRPRKHDIYDTTRPPLHLTQKSRSTRHLPPVASHPVSSSAQSLPIQSKHHVMVSRYTNASFPNRVILENPLYVQAHSFLKMSTWTKRMCFCVFAWCV